MGRFQRLHDIIVFATNRHAGQFDKQGMPYILHPFTAMMLLNSHDEDLNCAIIGHDLKEDCGVTDDDLRAIGQSDRTIRIIGLKSKKPGQTQEEYEDEILGDVDTMICKEADLRHNSDITRLKGCSEKDIARMARYMSLSWRIKERLDEMGVARALGRVLK